MNEELKRPNRGQLLYFFFSSRRRHTRCSRDWSSDVCSSDLEPLKCWCQALSGTAKIAPAFHSKLMRFPAVFQTAVEPRSGTRRSEEHTSELQSRLHLVCRLLLEKKKKKITTIRKKRYIKA